MPIKPSANGCDKHNSMVNRHIGSAYTNVKIVAENIEEVIEAANGFGVSVYYLGPFAVDPTEGTNGNPLVDGNFYFNTVDADLRYYSETEMKWIVGDAETVLEYAMRAEAAALAAEQSATNAAQSATDAANSADQAQDILDQINAGDFVSQPELSERAGYPWEVGSTSVKDRLYVYQPAGEPQHRYYDPVGGNVLGVAPDANFTKYGGGSGGTDVHNDLSGRNEPDAHDVSAIRFDDDFNLEDILNYLINSQEGGNMLKYPYDYVTKPEDKPGTFVAEGGSTWWVGDAIGRTFGGVDEWYVGAVKSTPEDNGADTIPEQQGLAIPMVLRVQLETDPTGQNSELMTVTETGVNKGEAKFVCDEHHQPAVFNNKRTGQIITAWGARGNAVNPDDEDFQRILYGSDSTVLGAVETVQWSTVPNYSQIFTTGNSVYVWSRVNVNTWEYAVGQGGQNYTQGAETFLDAGAGVQYYLNQKYIDSTECGGTDSADLRSRVHCFAQAHPTVNPDRTLRYAMAEYVVGGTYDSEYSEAGLIYKQPTSGNKLGTNGKLGSMGTLAPTDLETAVQFTGDTTYRVLDVQNGFAPRALLCVFEGTWEHGDTIPLGTTWDLVLVEFNEWTKTWSQFTVKSGLRGALGYAPWASATIQAGGIAHGQEGFTSFYAHGACFYRGKSGQDVAPIIYLAHRLGDDMTEHRLTEIHLNDTYNAVSKEVDLTPLLLPNSQVDWNTVDAEGIPAYRPGVNGSREIIYRPNAVQGGNKRGLFVNMATGWSSFTSYVASFHGLPRAYADTAPRVSQQTGQVIAPVNTWVTMGVTGENTGSAELTYQWYYKDVGDPDYTIINGSTSRTHDYNVQSNGNGRVYQCRVTNLQGTTESADILITVS